MFGASLTFDERVDDEEICLAMQTLQVTDSSFALNNCCVSFAKLHH